MRPETQKQQTAANSRIKTSAADNLVKGPGDELAKDARGNIVGPPKNGTVVMILQLPCMSALLSVTRKSLSVKNLTFSKQK